MKYIILHIVLGLGLLSCQDEFDIDTSNENTNNKESVFTAKAERNSMLDGSVDDILDQSPCSSVMLPAQIALNQAPFTVNTPDDLKAIQATDVVQLIYPVTLTTQDYKTVVIHDEQELMEHQNKCDQLIAEDQGPITCVEIAYPISVFTAIAHEQQNKITIENKKDFFFFLNNLSTEIYSIDYPISVRINETVMSIENDASYLQQLDTCTN